MNFEGLVIEPILVQISLRHIQRNGFSKKNGLKYLRTIISLYDWNTVNVYRKLQQKQEYHISSLLSINGDLTIITCSRKKDENQCPRFKIDGTYAPYIKSFSPQNQM